MAVISSATDEKLDLFVKDCVETANRLRLAINSYRLPPPPGATADDLIDEAIIAVRLGARKWPDGVDAFNLLWGIIRSRVSHFWEKEGRMQPTHIGPDITLQARTDSKYLRPREDMEAQAAFHELRDKMLALVADDPLLERIVELLAKDLKPKEVADELGISMKEMHNAQKRLRRKLSTLRAEEGEVK
jgi:DNA-directed RNA polymerase specialized sigma24 family protein